MIATLIQSVKKRTSALEKFLRLCDACDEATANPSGLLYNELSARSAIGSDLKEERIFRHCAIVTQLYSIYESFAGNTLSFWLTRLPRYQPFPDLPEPFRNAYRYGIARIMKEAGSHRFRNLSITHVLENYLVSLKGEPQWEFVSEALTTHERNLRRTEFEKMFNSAGLHSIWPAIERNKKIAAHRAESDANESLEQIIQNLVTSRNDASHGTPDEILGAEPLREWITFVRAFCEALLEVITHRIVQLEAKHKQESVIGRVTEIFRDNIVVATCSRGALKIGDNLFFVRKTDCTRASIESLQVNGVNQTEVQIAHEDSEIGLRTSVKVHRNSRLVRMDDLL